MIRLTKKEDGKSSESIEKTLEDKLPVFLKSVKEASPLAVLSSICIAVAAFTHTVYPTASAFALAGATSFLIGFVGSLLFKIMKFYLISIYVYISFIVGVALMFGFLIEFGENILMVSKTSGVIISLAGYTLITISSISYAKKFKNSKGKVMAFSAVLSEVFAVGLFIITTIYLVLYFFNVAPSIQTMLFMMFASIIIVDAISVIIAVLWTRRRRN
jgi:hypothetical protein